jgi:CHAD domain-containing protein
MTIGTREVEWQFDVADHERARSWLEGAELPAGFVARPEAAEALRDVYLDTPDWRLHSAGATLRVRHGASGGTEATLKSRGSSVDGLRDREELTEACDASMLDQSAALRALPGAVGDRLRAALPPDAELRPLFEIRTARGRHVILRDGIAVAEVALDESQVVVDGTTTALTLRVELEARGASVEELSPLVETLRAATGATPSAQSKFGAALAIAGLAPPEPLTAASPAAAEPSRASLELALSAPAGEAVLALVAGLTQQVEARRPGTLAGEVEELHQMRVALRRLRSTLRSYRRVLPAAADELRAELGWVAGVLGVVRDLDVQREQLGALRTELPAAVPAIERLEQHATVADRGARESMVSALHGERYRALIAALTAFVAAPAAGDRATRPLGAVAGGLLRREVRRLHAGLAALKRDASDERYHAARIEAKRVRYLLDPLAAGYGKPARSFVRGLAALQDALGRHQDAAVGLERLAALGAEPEPPPAEALAALAEAYRALRAEARREARSRRRALRDGPWHALAERLRAAQAPPHSEEATARGTHR